MALPNKQIKGIVKDFCNDNTICCLIAKLNKNGVVNSDFTVDLENDDLGTAAHKKSVILHELAYYVALFEYNIGMESLHEKDNYIIPFDELPREYQQSFIDDVMHALDPKIKDMVRLYNNSSKDQNMFFRK